MAAGSQHTEVRFAEQLHEDNPPPINRRLPRRASTFQYGAPADSSGSESNERHSTFRKRAKHSSLYSRLRRARHKFQKKDSQAPTLPAPVHLAQTENDEEAAEAAVDRPVGSAESVPADEVRRAETVDVEGNRSSPPRARFGFRFPRLFSKKQQIVNRSTTTSGSSSYYSEYTYSASSESSDEEEIANDLIVYHCHTQETPLTTKRNTKYFDSSEYVTGETRARHSNEDAMTRELTEAFRAAYTDEAPNAVKLVLIHNDEEAFSGLLRNVHSDSQWFATYGRPLLNQIEPEGYNAPPRKTKLYPIRNDEKRQMAQGAICINHWVHSLPDHDEETENHSHDDSSSDIVYSNGDDDTNTLQQLIIFWQYRRSFEPGFQDEAATAPETASVYDPDRIETAAETTINTSAKSMPKSDPNSSKLPPPPPARSANKSAAGLASASHRKSKKSAAAPKNVEEWREPLLRSNMIVVFEKSVVNSRTKKSVVLDDLSAVVSSGGLLVGTNNMYTSNENLKGLNDIHLINDVVERIFESLEEDLNMRIDSYVTRCARLDREVHQRPENDKISRKLWMYSKQFQIVKKKLNTIVFLVSDIRLHLVENGLSKDFLSTLASRLRIIAEDVEEDLRKPVVEMIDLVYKSISINDARRSMELNASLWRLSWVTFIFLPLTFLVGFFGMNVDVFANDPAIKWYFIAAIPFFLCIMISWLLFKHFMTKYSSFKELLLHLLFGIKTTRHRTNATSIRENKHGTRSRSISGMFGVRARRRSDVIHIEEHHTRRY